MGCCVAGTFTYLSFLLSPTFLLLTCIHFAILKGECLIFSLMEVRRVAVRSLAYCDKLQCPGDVTWVWLSLTRSNLTICIVSLLELDRYHIFEPILIKPRTSNFTDKHKIWHVAEGAFPKLDNLYLNSFTAIALLENGRL